MRGSKKARMRAAIVAAMSILASTAMAAPAADASLLSLLPGSCGSQSYTQPFAPWGDGANYVATPGGSFEPGSIWWPSSGGAAPARGNESFYVRGSTDAYSLALPSGSSATSPPACTSIYHPTMRFFLRNTGSASSQLKVEALYPGLLGGVQAARLGVLQGTAAWKPSPVMQLLVSNLLSTLSLSRTTIAFRFTPLDRTGAWSIDDVYLDPRMK
jgi:hypothetical protein